MYVENVWCAVAFGLDPEVLQQQTAFGAGPRHSTSCPPCDGRQDAPVRDTPDLLCRGVLIVGCYAVRLGLGPLPTRHVRKESVWAAIAGATELRAGAHFDCGRLDMAGDSSAYALKVQRGADSVPTGADPGTPGTGAEGLPTVGPDGTILLV